MLCRFVGRLRRPGGLLPFDELERDDGDVVVAARLVGRIDERASGEFGVTAGGVDDLENVLVAEHRGQPVGADEKEVARLGFDRERVHVDVGVGAEHACDHEALRVIVRFLLRQAAAADELGDE